MRLYHYSVDSYRGGDRLINDYKKGYRFAEPFLLALRKGKDTFLAVYYAAMYTGRELMALNLRKYENCYKDAVEALFEYVRETEYPDEPGRLQCVYYCKTKNEMLSYVEADCLSDGLFTKDQVVLLEVDVEEQRIREYDQTFYNRALEEAEKQDFEKVLEMAHNYYSGRRSDDPLIEIVSDGANQVVRQIDY